MNKNAVKYLGAALLGLMILSSCSKEKSIQEYYVEKQESDEFIAVDLPASLLDLGDEVSEETKETMATIKKLNVLAFRVNEDNKEEYSEELKMIKSILKSDRYTQLMRMKHENVNIIVNYEGDDDSIDEFIVLAADGNQGFAVARILGDKMKPANIMKMADDIKHMDANGEAMAELSGIFEEMGVQ